MRKKYGRTIFCRYINKLKVGCGEYSSTLTKIKMNLSHMWSEVHLPTSFLSQRKLVVQQVLMYVLPIFLEHNMHMYKKLHELLMRWILLIRAEEADSTNCEL